MPVYRAGTMDCAGRQSVARHEAGVREFACDMSVHLTVEHDRDVPKVSCEPRFIEHWMRWVIRPAES